MKQSFNPHYFWGGFVWLTLWIIDLARSTESLEPNLLGAVIYLLIVFGGFIWFMQKAGGK